MSALDNITELAQDTYYTVNGSTSTATGDKLTTFQNNFIRGFNLFLDELDTEAYWNKLRVNDYELATIADTTTYSFVLPSTYRTPIFNQDKYVKVIASDGSTVLARFKLVDPNQRVNDDPYAISDDRATFLNGNVVLSRPPKDTEVGSTLVLDVVKYYTKLTTSDDTAINQLPSRQLGVLGVAKNTSLSNVTKVALSPSFTQRYKNELDKQLVINDASNEVYDSLYSDFGYVTGAW